MRTIMLFMSIFLESFFDFLCIVQNTLIVGLILFCICLFLEPLASFLMNLIVEKTWLFLEISSGYAVILIGNMILMEVVNNQINKTWK